MTTSIGEGVNTPRLKRERPRKEEVKRPVGTKFMGGARRP